MPIEIRELIIKATVASGSNAGGGSQAAGGEGNNTSPSEEIVNTCVDKILEILRDKHER